MKRITQDLASKYHAFFSDHSGVLSLIVSFIFLLGSLLINFFASQYAYVSRSNSVTDIVLDNIPVVHIEPAFIAGTIIFLIFVAALLISNPHKISFVVKSVALFVLVRSLFITLTHLAPSPLNTLSAPGEIGRAFSSGADLFFSGHTGMPFLFALIYWKNKTLRGIFLCASLLAAAAVLFGHVHYSIDVASAFFITYGIYILASQELFKKDYNEFHKNVS